MADKKKKTDKTGEEGKKKAVAEEETSTDRLRVKIFCGSSDRVENNINSWLGEGKEKEVVRSDCGVCVVKSSFSSGGEEKEIYCVFHYKFVANSIEENKA